MTLCISTESISETPRGHLAHPRLSLAERRRGLRIERRRPVKLFDASALRFVAGETRDISSTGLKIEVPSAGSLFAGQIVQVYVSHADGGAIINRQSMMPARVVWVEADPEAEGTMVAGVEFVSNHGARATAA